MIEVLSTGLPNSVQDLGRQGFLGIGVAHSGAMDAYALQTANILVGNSQEQAAIEVSLFPFRLRFHVDTVFACTGADAELRLDERELPAWWSRSARAGQTLVIGAPVTGARVYLAFAGGIDVPEVLGSRSTDLKSGFGGLGGRGLRRGDKLTLLNAEPFRARPVGLGVAPKERVDFRAQAKAGCITLRVLPAAQWPHFTKEARARFVNQPYKVTPQANRQGFRLEGEALQLTEPMELLSHGIVAGTVQVPPSGQPIIQLAEANTCGGYPKIATVIAADLWRLAQAPIGWPLRFDEVDTEQATAALRSQHRSLSSMEKTLKLMAGRN